MITKIFNLWCYRDTSGRTAVQGVGHEKFQAFYTNLVTQISTLENQLGQEPCFSLAWMLSAMNTVKWVHSSVYALIEEVWLPMRKTVGDVLEMYLDVSVKLLEMCNYLRDGVGELDYVQLSLEHCLESLGALIGRLSHTEDSDEFVAARKELEICRLELENMESKTASNLWLEMKSKSKGPRGKSSNSAQKQAEQRLSSLERSYSVLPSPSLSKEAFLITQVMTDVQVVITFISNLLLWVLTDTSEQFSFVHDFDRPRFASGRTDGWSAAFLSLRDRIENSELKHKKSNCALSLKEIRVVHGAVRDLTEQVENEVQHSAEAGRMDRSEIALAALEQSREKLHDMTQISDRLSLETQVIFSQILQCQEKIMKFVEKQLMRSITI